MNLKRFIHICRSLGLWLDWDHNTHLRRFCGFKKETYSPHVDPKNKKRFDKMLDDWKRDVLPERLAEIKTRLGVKHLSAPRKSNR